MTTVEPASPTTDPHLTGVFAPNVAEIDASDLRVEGELPAEDERTDNSP